MSEEIFPGVTTPVAGPLAVTPLFASASEIVWWDGASWNELPALIEAVSDNTSYARENAGWTNRPAFLGASIIGTAPGLLAINRNAAAGIVNPVATVLQVQQADGLFNGVQLNAFGAGAGNHVVGLTAGGTGAAPAALGGQPMLILGGRGYDGNAWSTNAAQITMQPIASPWTTGDHSTCIQFSTIPVGSTALTAQLVIGPGVSIGSPTAPASPMMTGDLNVQGRIMINGAAVGTGGGGGGLPETPLAVVHGGSGTTTFPPVFGGPGIVVGNGTAALATNPNFQLSGASLTGTDATGSGGGPAFVGYSSRGTLAAPTTTQSGDTLAEFAAGGYGTTGWGGIIGTIVFFANQAFTDSAQGTMLRVRTTPNNSVTPQAVLFLQNGMQLGQPAGGDMGLGTLNAAAGLYINGVAVGAGGGADTVSPAVTAAGTTQGTATALTSQFNNVTIVAGGTGVVLPAGTAGAHCIVRNSGANPLLCYPASGAAINAQAVNTAITLLGNSTAYFEAQSATQWFTVP